jgi:short-subunit dehydrogenase
VSTPIASENWVLLLGSTSGIGKAIARKWAANGVNLLLAARDTDENNRLAADLAIRFGISAKPIAFDALAFAEHEAFWKECVAQTQGNLQGVILVYGYMCPRDEADRDAELVRKTIEVNYTSAVLILNLAGKEFESRRRGYICGFSSVAGDRGRQSNYYYGSSKAAFSAYLQGLRNRLFKNGVSVITVKPGFVDTAMTWGMPGMFLVATPKKVATDTWNAVRRKRSVLYTPFFWRYIMLIIRSIPEFIFKRMKL